MERPQAFANLWLVVRTAAWVAALDGVAEFFTNQHHHAVIRRLILLFLDRDPARPRAPDSWEEWYNS